jgi:hypothetical protein
LITNVPARSSIIFHWGNTFLDTSGCVLVGNRVGVLLGKRGVLGSKETFRNMMTKLSDVDEFELEVRGKE